MVPRRRPRTPTLIQIRLITGIVVGISPQDYRADAASSGTVNPLDGIAFQRALESRALSGDR